jgi:hypothetical protein
VQDDEEEVEEEAEDEVEDEVEDELEEELEEVLALASKLVHSSSSASADSEWPRSRSSNLGGGGVRGCGRVCEGVGVCVRVWEGVRSEE